MSTRTASRNPKAGAPGFKALVTAVSLAATLGGWAVISAGAQTTNPQTNNTLPPMPTLVPTPEPYVAPVSAAGGSSTARGSVNGTRSNSNSPSSTTTNKPSVTTPNLRSVTIPQNVLPQIRTRPSR